MLKMTRGPIITTCQKIMAPAASYLVDEKKDKWRKLAQNGNLATRYDSFVKRYEHRRQVN